MQGRQNLSSTERKGPHKSMHCKFCKPPGVVTPEKATGPTLETKTKIHLAHEGADLRLTNAHDEPGFPKPESEVCICVLEGENPCPKCVPDKSRPPKKKKVCNCPKGAKPHPSMFVAAPVKKKQVEEDDEFWWEKYSREHDAFAKEAWAAYMAQRRKEKKLEKCKKLENRALIEKYSKASLLWYQKLSCQQMIYVEYLSTAIRLDSDENITDRTHFVLAGLGLYPRPKRSVLRRCLRFCHYNAIRFLDQLHIVMKEEDPFEDKQTTACGETKGYTWNERLIMNSLCYLEFPAFLRELMDRLPRLKRQRILPLIPYPASRVLPNKKYDCPYEEPIWQDRPSWIDKMKIDRLNRCRLHMETKRVKIPPLALVRRPSLIDARPPFLAQIEANERASRRLVKDKEKKTRRKHPISTFNSAVDVTAIAGIEASEISTTDKADTDDICVFLREPKEPESTEGEVEEELLPEKEVKFLERSPCNQIKPFSEENSEEEAEAEENDIPFKTPPKTESGETIGSPCPPPDSTPGPPATHFERGKRELDVLNKEVCGFFPFVSSSTMVGDEGEGNENQKDDVELKLKWAAEKLKKLVREDSGGDKPKKKSKKTCKRKGKRKKKRSKKLAKPVEESPPATVPDATNAGEEGEGEISEGGFQMTDDDEDREDLDLDLEINFRTNRELGTKSSKRSSEASDPDPDSDDDWPVRPPCFTDSSKVEEDAKPIVMKKTKRRKVKCSRRKQRRKKKVVQPMKGNRGKMKKEKEHDGSTMEGKTTDGEEKEKESEDTKPEVFKGDVWPLVSEIVKDLKEEGFYCASYPSIERHPDVQQLIEHLKGIIVNKKLKKKLYEITQFLWAKRKALKRYRVQDLEVSTKKLDMADWNDKKWLSRLAKKKIDQFYYKVAKYRSDFAIEFYRSLHQSYIGSDRYLKVFYAYMPSKFEDAILRGIF